MASATPKNAPYRPKSPEHFKSLSTRCREKEELQDLNERLLVYVNHMRSLKEIEETETHVQVSVMKTISHKNPQRLSYAMQSSKASIIV